MGAPARATTRHRLTRTVTAAALAVGLAAGGALAVMPSAQAAVARSFISTPDGMVGVTQNVVIKAPKLKGQAVTVAFTNGGVTTPLQTVVNAQGFASIAWNPGATGPWTLAGQGSLASAASTTVTVAAMPTVTSLISPNLVQSGTGTSLLVQVAAPIGSIAPAGTVTVMTAYGQTVGTATLAASGTSTAIASVGWTPPAVPSVPLYATFTPASSSVTASTSTIVTPSITSAGVTVALRFAPSMYAGQPTVLQAVLGTGVPAGSVAFSVDGKTLDGSVPTVDGIGSIDWTAVDGSHLIGVNFTSNTRKVSGVSTQWLKIGPAPAPDGMSVAPQGAMPWSVSVPASVKPGVTANLGASSSSGSTVLLSVTGPCILNGAAFTALSAGTCQVTATSPGGAGFGAAQATFTVNAA